MVREGSGKVKRSKSAYDAGLMGEFKKGTGSVE